jgi:hypothetical protein
MTHLDYSKTTNQLLVELVATLKSLQKYSNSKSVKESAKDRINQLKDYTGKNPDVLMKLVRY